MFEEWKFCPMCNYAISDLQFYSLKYDLPCPRCHCSNVSNFYSYGSPKHLEITESHACFQVDERLKPLSFPKEVK